MDANLKKYVQLYKPVLGKLDNLIDRIREISVDESYKELEAMRDAANQNFEKLSKIKVSIGISDYFFLWSSLVKFAKSVDEVVRLVKSRFGKQMKTFVTQSTMGHLIREEHQLVDMNARASTRSHLILAELQDIFADAILQLLNDEVLKLQAEFRVDPLTADLYVDVMNRLLKRYAEDRRFDMTNLVSRLVEEDKKWILQRGVSAVKTNPEIPLTNFGLTPLSASRPLTELAEVLRVGPKDVASIEKLSSCLNKQGIDLVVIYKVIEYPIEYDIFGLLSKSIDKNAGITEALINQFKTLTISDTKSKWCFNIKFYKTNGEKAVVLRCTSDKYSPMSLFLGGPTHLFKTSLQNLYDQDKDPKRDNYNLKAIRAAKDSMFLDVAFKVDEVPAVDIMVGDVINSLFLEISSEFVKKLPKTYPKDISMLRELFANEKYKEIAKKTLTHKFHEFFQKNTYDVAAYLGEAQMTFLFQLVYFERSFFTELVDAFNNYISGMQPEDENLNALKTKFERVVVSILEKLISQDSNIFIDVMRKVSLSKLSLIK